MSSKHHPASCGSSRPEDGLAGQLKGKGLRVGIAAARFNLHVTNKLVEGAKAAFIANGVAGDDVVLVWAPGAFELAQLAQLLVDRGVDAVVCLGAVIRGDTAHFDFVAGECAAGIRQVGLDTGAPVIFGVLTTDTVEQAMDRAGGEYGNKGAEAAEAALEMVDVIRQISLHLSDEDTYGETEPSRGRTGPKLFKL